MSVHLSSGRVKKNRDSKRPLQPITRIDKGSETQMKINVKTGKVRPKRSVSFQDVKMGMRSIIDKNVFNRFKNSKIDKNDRLEIHQLGVGILGLESDSQVKNLSLQNSSNFSKSYLKTPEPFLVITPPKSKDVILRNKLKISNEKLNDKISENNALRKRIVHLEEKVKNFQKKLKSPKKNPKSVTVKVPPSSPLTPTKNLNVSSPSTPKTPNSPLSPNDVQNGGKKSEYSSMDKDVLIRRINFIDGKFIKAKELYRNLRKKVHKERKERKERQKRRDEKIIEKISGKSKKKMAIQVEEILRLKGENCELAKEVNSVIEQMKEKDKFIEKIKREYANVKKQCIEAKRKWQYVQDNYRDVILKKKNGKSKAKGSNGGNKGHGVRKSSTKMKRKKR